MSAGEAILRLGENMSKVGSKKYALLVPAVALASLALVHKTEAAAPTLSNSSPTTGVNDVLPELGSTNSSIIAAAGLSGPEAFQNDGTSDPDAPVEAISGGTSEPVMLDLVASDSGGTLTGGGAF